MEGWGKGVHVRGVLLEEEGLNKYGGSICIGKGGGFSAVATSQGYVPGVSEASELQIDGKYVHVTYNFTK